MEDLGHILRRYFPARDMVEIKAHSRSTRLEQQQVILKLLGYRPCDAAAKEELVRKAQRIAMLSTQPVFILREIFQYLTNQRIVAPGYTYLQDMVGRIVSGERLRITRLLGEALTTAVEQQLEALLQADEGPFLPTCPAWPYSGGFRHYRASSHNLLVALIAFRAIG